MGVVVVIIIIIIILTCVLFLSFKINFAFYFTNTFDRSIYIVLDAIVRNVMQANTTLSANIHKEEKKKEKLQYA